MMDEIAYCMTCGKKLPVPASGYVTHGGDDCIRKLKQDIARLTAEVKAMKAKPITHDITNMLMGIPVVLLPYIDGEQIYITQKLYDRWTQSQLLPQPPEAE